ncbi:hypothetical protein SAMN04489745_3475 [Arthrobacter woluwensis]|uniref:CcmD family protein n=1 Tax=Arthrobacter woluwensis TaxID=156980 RepID=A0A1H4WCQ5_9MICC|nr:hypothetical protein SAMN04489745_3134 [Arthrobacter woluwensis]SEC90538.1 hypothetical protein SAMN04489745_3475 [Arthrobacter woluwensis]
MSIMSAASILISLATFLFVIWTLRTAKKTSQALKETQRILDDEQARNRGNVR